MIGSMPSPMPIAACDHRYWLAGLLACWKETARELANTRSRKATPTCELLNHVFHPPRVRAADAGLTR